MDHQILRRYFKGELTEAERREVEAWLERSEALPQDYAYEEQVKLDLWKDISIGIRQSGDYRGRRFRYLSAIAAILLIGVGIIALLYYPIQDVQHKVEWHELEAPMGKRKQLRLADQTEIVLNGGSAIAYSKQGGSHPKIRYLRGEVYLSIVPKAHRPFSVALPDKSQIQVLGTSFAIDGSRGLDDLRVTLLSGKIRLNSPRGKSYLLQPGEQLVLIDKQSVHIQAVNVNKEIAWKNQLLWFDDVPVQEVFDRLEREFGIHITASQRISPIRITAKFQRAPLDKVLRLLEESTKIHFKREGNKVIAF